jgi:hypothetical protein
MIHGDKILQALDEIKKSGTPVADSEDGTSKIFKITSKDYEIEVVVTPEKWLGLTFSIPQTKVNYEINTDLYDLTLPKYSEFTQQIESDIVAFLDSFRDKKILISSNKKQVLIPLSSEFVLLNLSGFFARTKSYKSLDEAKEKFDSDYIALVS